MVGGGLERPCGDSMDKPSSKWSEITAAESADDFWDLVGQMDPRALCCNFTSLQKFVEWKYRTDPAEYASPAGIQFDLSRSRGLDDWCATNLTAPITDGERSPRSRYHHRSGPSLRSGLRSARVSPGLANPLRSAKHN